MRGCPTCIEDGVPESELLTVEPDPNLARIADALERIAELLDQVIDEGDRHLPRLRVAIP
jgi:hypothetical protein